MSNLDAAKSALFHWVEANVVPEKRAEFRELLQQYGVAAARHALDKHRPIPYPDPIFESIFRDSYKH